MAERGTWRSGWQAAAVVAALTTLTACATGPTGSAAVGTPAGADGATSTAGPQTSDRDRAPNPGAESAVHPVTTVLVGDDATLATAGPPAEGSWPAVLADRLGQAGAPMAVTMAAEGGAGFVPDAPSAPSFTDLVRSNVQHSTQLVVFHDTGTEAAAADALEEAAAAAFQATEEAAPDARIVLVVPAADAGVREALASAARGAELPVTLVDATSEGWPASPGQAELADLLAPHVADLVGALARSGAFE